MTTVRTTGTDVTADVAFLRDRCGELQRELTSGGCARFVPGHDHDLGDDPSLSRWTRLLVPSEPWAPDVQDTLEELYVLHARVTERLVRGGVGDISADVESLVAAVLVDRLQHLTDRAVDAISR